MEGGQNKFKIVDESGDRKYFSIIPNYIVNHSTALEQALYLNMKRIAGEHGTCWTSADTLGKKMGLSGNTVRKYRDMLVKRGWIKKVGERPVGRTSQLTNEYEIVDLWELNTKYYSEGKPSTIESFQPVRESFQPLSSKPSTVGGKEEHSEEELIKKSGRFAPPSLEEVTNYCLERKNLIYPQKFINFYEAKGWFIGKNKMVSWKAAVRNWENRDKKVGNILPSPAGKYDHVK